MYKLLFQSPYKWTDGKDFQKWNNYDDIVNVYFAFNAFECVRVRMPTTLHAQCMRKGGRGRQIREHRSFPNTQGTKWRLYSFGGGGVLLMNSEQQSIHFKSLSHRAAVSDIQITLQLFYDS
jgi:hypothetical protein